ncbi:MAG: nickel-dependent lactate racemase, partial [Clostridia bacterium]|nr:nickel-dependent lactate racemase [Clostridia bacterium]
MQFTFKYGKKDIKIKLSPENFIGKIEPQEMEGLSDPVQAVREALENPIGSPRLDEIAALKKPGKVVIIVNDLTRVTPYQHMLPPLLAELAEAGVKDGQITFVVATGNHRGHSEQENRELYTEEIAGRYVFINHDCTKDLVSMGRLTDGNELMVNKHVAEADMVITTGLINPHQIAGFSGGRKSIMPGVVSKELITLNHSRMTAPGAKLGNYQDNPVHHMMMEVAGRVGVDFILNAVTNSNREIVKVVAGELEQAWIAGVDVSRKMNMVKLAEQADVVIASAGGYPKDINVYQAQKALTNAAEAVKSGGTVILVAQCPEGFGDSVFEEWTR